MSADIDDATAIHILKLAIEDAIRHINAGGYVVSVEQVPLLPLAMGHFIPLIVENVRGAIPWMGRSRWNYGSFHLWGDVPALMPMTKAVKVPGFRFDGSGGSLKTAAVDGVKQGGISGMRENGKGDAWFQDGAAHHGSKSKARKAASAAIAKIVDMMSLFGIYLDKFQDAPTAQEIDDIIYDEEFNRPEMYQELGRSLSTGY